MKINLHTNKNQTSDRQNAKSFFLHAYKMKTNCSVNHYQFVNETIKPNQNVQTCKFIVKNLH